MTAVTSPPGVTVANAAFVLVHVPPESGDNIVVSCSHIVVAPVTATVVFGLTSILIVASDSQPRSLVIVTV